MEKKHLARAAPSLPALVFRGAVAGPRWSTQAAHSSHANRSPRPLPSLCWRPPVSRSGCPQAVRRGCKPLPVVALFDKLSPRLLTGRALFAAVSVGVWAHSCTFGDLVEVVPTHTAASGSFFAHCVPGKQ